MLSRDRKHVSEVWIYCYYPQFGRLQGSESERVMKCICLCSWRYQGHLENSPPQPRVHTALTDFFLCKPLPWVLRKRHIHTHFSLWFLFVCFCCLFVCCFARCLRFKGNLKGNLCSHLDWGTEMSCSHAVDVDRRRTRFFFSLSVCHHTQAECTRYFPATKDTCWHNHTYPFFPPSAPSASHPALLWVFMCCSMYSTTHTGEPVTYFGSGAAAEDELERTVYLQTLVDSPVDRLPLQKEKPMLSYSLKFFYHLQVDPI